MSIAAAILEELDHSPALRERLRAIVNADDARILEPIEAAARLGIHVKTLYRYAAQGRIPGAYRKEGTKLWRFREKELRVLPLPGPGGAGPARGSLRLASAPDIDAIRGGGSSSR